MLKLRPTASAAAPSAESRPPKATIANFQLCSQAHISVYRFASPLFGQAGRSNCRNDIALAKKGRQTMWRGRESEAKGEGEEQLLLTGNL